MSCCLPRPSPRNVYSEKPFQVDGQMGPSTAWAFCRWLVVLVPCTDFAVSVLSQARGRQAVDILEAHFSQPEGNLVCEEAAPGFWIMTGSL